MLALPPFSIWPLLLPTIGGLFLLLADLRPARAALLGWLFGIGFFLAGLSWIGESFEVDAERFGAFKMPAILALSAGLALFSAAASALYARFAEPGPMGALWFSACWTAGEWLRGHLLTGFPWNLIGYTWVGSSAAPIQGAAWIGSYGLSLITVLSVALLAAPLQSGRSRSERRRDLTLGAALVTALWGAGAVRLWIAPAPVGTEITVRIVQANVPQALKWRPDQRETIIERHLTLSVPDQVGYDVLLWPETAVPSYLAEDGDLRARIAEVLPPGAILLAGAPRRVWHASEIGYRNAIIAVGPDGRVLGTYDKHHLVPFGEYVPLRHLLPFERLVVGAGDFTPGPGPRTLDLPGLPPVGLSICYEAIFPGAVVAAENRPAWLFNATNDAWFGTSIGPWQHLGSARMRAVEEGLPLIRAANSGVSAVIDAYGRVRQALPVGATGTIQAALPPALGPTPYSRYGDAPLGLLLASAFALTLWRRASGKSNSAPCSL